MLKSDNRYTLLTIPPSFRRSDDGTSKPIDSTRGIKVKYVMPDMSVYIQAKADKVAREARSDEIAEHKMAVINRKADQLQLRMDVLGKVRQGHDTVMKINKLLDIPATRITSALKWLIKEGKVVRVSRRTYGVK